MAASLLTCSGASVGVSISTQRRMPSRIVLESKELVVAVIGASLLSRDLNNVMRSGPRASQLAPRGMTAISALVGSFAGSDLFDQFDNTAAKLGVGDAGERARQRQA